MNARLRRPGPRVALTVLALMLVAVLLGPALSPWTPGHIDFAGAWSSPPSVLRDHWFGTDSNGRSTPCCRQWRHRK